MSGGMGHRHGSDPVLLWLWCRPAAVAPTGRLAWELPYAAGMALKSKKRKTEEKVAKSIDLSSFHHKEKNYNYVW